jgi:hypothetical protein
MSVTAEPIAPSTRDEKHFERVRLVRPKAHSIPSTHGYPLDVITRRRLDAHFGTDLADVRVNTGSEAARSATSLEALAYSSGRDIYFAREMYGPAGDSGRRLLAHEVAHVVQQASGKKPRIAPKSARGVKIGGLVDMLETEPERAAEEVMLLPRPSRTAWL